MATTTKEELQERAQLIRIHEGNCRLVYPSVDDANFRIAIMKKIGFAFGLKEVRNATIAGPIQTTPPRPKMAGK